MSVTASGLYPVEKCRRSHPDHWKYRRSMNICKYYHIAKDIPDALQAKAGSAGQSCFVAGGTDLLVDLQQDRNSSIDSLIDISDIPELNVIELRKTHLFVGAAVTHARISDSDSVIQHAQALGDACGLIGGPQIRNVATIGGNVANALPAADGAIAMLALKTEVEIVNQSGSRIIPLSDLFIQPGLTTLKDDELLAGFNIPIAQKKQSSVFKRIVGSQGKALPILNVAVWIERDGEIIKDIRVSVGPSGPVPRLIEAASMEIRGKMYHEEAIKENINRVASEIKFRSSPQRASSGYRNHLAALLLEEAIDVAWTRANL